MPVETSWTELSGIQNPGHSWWEAVLLVGAIILLVAPLYWWKEHRATTWRWWKSVLFVVVWLCALLPVAIGIGNLTGDNHATADVDGVVAQVAATAPAMIGSPAAGTLVEPSEQATRSTLYLPYQGEEFSYTVEFTAFGPQGPAQCHGRLWVRRDAAARGQHASVFGRFVGLCPLATAGAGPQPG